MTAVWIGLDPGVRGAVCVLTEHGPTFFDTPTVTTKGTRQEYLTPQMAKILAPYRDREDVKAALEQGIAMPGQASSSTFSTGLGNGIWQGILAAYAIPYDLVRAQVWKKAMGLPPGADKDASRALASRLFPAQEGWFARKKDADRAEAALMAEWRRRFR